MNDSATATKLDPKWEVRAKLLAKGHTITSFARKHVFNVQTVDRTIARHFRGEYLNPRGQVTKTILEKIQDEIGACDGNGPEEAAR